jgi:signal transduction histidine kinase
MDSVIHRRWCVLFTSFIWSAKDDTISQVKLEGRRACNEQSFLDRRWYRSYYENKIMARYRSRFYQISLVFAVTMLFFSFHSLINIIVNGKTLTAGRALDFSIYAVSAILFLALLGVSESRVTRIVQVVVMVVSGTFITAVVTPGEIGGDLMVIVAAFAAYKYGLMHTYTLPKLLVLIGAVIATRGVLVVFHNDISIHRTLGQSMIPLTAIPILYWVFEDESRRISRQKEELELQAKADRPFVEFGKNVGGIVHDFKNDLGLFSMFGQLLYMNIGETITERQVEEYQDYVRRFSARIERILLITRIARDENPRKTELLSLIRSVLYVFQTNLNFRRVVNFLVEFPDDQGGDDSVFIETIPLEVVAILENVVRNSCEALVDHYGSEPEAISRALLRVQCTVQEGEVVVVIEDNGPGIAPCLHCSGSNCLDCDIFEIGKSTKDGGSGFGLVNVRSSARRIGAAVSMTSRNGEGVRTEIRFPRRQKLTVEFTPEYTRSNQNN